MRHSDGYLDTRHSVARGTSHLYCQCWDPDGETRANILLVHGLGEHSGRYEHVARTCTSQGFRVHSLDHYGHGKSDGQPGYVERFSVYLDGVAALLKKIQMESRGLPLFLVGHSMGGLIAAAFLLDNQAAFRACLLSGPLFKTDAAPPALLLGLVRLLARILPTVPMMALDPGGVSRDPKIVTAYIEDPLVFHGRLSARLIAELFASMQSALARAAEIHLPIMFLHGEEDLLASPAGSIEMHERVASTDKSLKIYPGLYHEIFNEPEQDEVLEDVTTWLEAHL